MKNFSYVTLVLITAFFSSFASANEVEIQSMQCRILNGFGVPVGAASLKGNQILMTLGGMQNPLWLQGVSENSVTGMTRGQSWDYIFDFTTPLKAGSGTYNGTLYKQYAMGMGGPRLLVGFVSCSIV